MHEHLQIWYDGWLNEYRTTDKSYVSRNQRDEVSLAQVHFVRDYLSGMLWADVPYEKRAQASAPREDCKETAFVIGEHTSKSVRLPVYSLERPDLGVQFVLRYNFHDWNVSVVSEKPVTPFLRGFETDFSSDRDREAWRPGNYWGYCFFQGFPEELRFGPYSLDQRKFSLTIGHEYGVYTFIWLIMRDLRQNPRDIQ